jgi:chemotaxis family two-component system response regulator Rcp1
MKNVSDRPHIVLIEDNPSDVYLLNYALEESGLRFEITNFQCGADAMLILCPDGESINLRRIVPDLILLDLNTPRSDGFDILSRIRCNAHLANTPVAILTSSDSPADKRRAALLGATMYIQKPTQLTAFVKDVGAAVKLLLATPRTAAHGRGAA